MPLMLLMCQMFSSTESSRGSGGGSWNGPVDRKMDSSWSGQDGWDNGTVLSQPAGSFTMQQGSMMAGGMGGGHVFIAQPAMQGPPVVMQSTLPRHGDTRFNIAAATVRRF